MGLHGRDDGAGRNGWGGPDRPTEDVERDVRDEVRFHIESRVRENVARGMSPEDARAEAEARFGDVDAVEREMRRVGRRRRLARRRRELLGDAARDVVLAVRTLVRRPAFATFTVLTLALGIGASTAVFSVANWILLRPVPGVRAPDSLVTVQVGWESAPEASMTLSHRAFQELREAANPLAELAAAQVIQANLWLPGTGRPRRVTAQYVSSGHASVLGLEAVAGRVLGPADRSSRYVAMIGHELWTTLFDGSPDAVGQTLSVNGRDFTVVGVAPRGFRGDALLGEPTQVWVPVEAHDAIVPQAGPDALANGYPLWLTFVGRLSDGANAEAVSARLNAAARGLQEEGAGLFPPSPLVRVEPGLGLSKWEEEQLHGIFGVLAGVVGLLLLLACANAANLLLARFEDRRPELAIRRAIGAGPGRILRVLLVEAAVLVILAGAAGVVLAAGAVRLFEGERFLAFMAPLSGIELDGTVLFFAVALSGFTGLLFGVVPSLLATRSPSTVHSTTRGATRPGPSPALVVAQVAISVTLVIGAGLLLDTVLALNGMDLGFRPGGVTEASVDPGAQGYDGARREAFFRELLESARALPGAAAVGLATYPVQGRQGASDLLRPEGLEEDDPRAVRTAWNQVSPGFIEAVGLELVAGRDFRREEMSSADAVVMVSESAARQMFPTGGAVGSRVEMGLRQPKTAEIVGVVRDARLRSVKDPGGPLALEPIGQRWTPNWATLYVRGRGSSAPAPADLHHLLRELDPALPLYDVQPLARRLAARLTAERVLARLTTLFAGLALLLAAVGLYGVLTMAVQSRTREMGIRLALGARPEQVRTLVIGRGVGLAALGLALGLVASTQATRLIETRLWGVRPLEPAVFGGAAVVLLVTALVACWMPAIRAARVDPVEALTEE